MKKSIIKRMLTAAMAATICISSSMYSYATVAYTNAVNTTPCYGDNRDFDLFANIDEIISAMYASNGSNVFQKTDIKITSDKQAHAIGQIIATIQDCNSVAHAFSYPNIEKLFLKKIDDNHYQYDYEGYCDKSTEYYYIGWYDTEDHTKDIDNIKVALEEAKRIASTVPEGTNEQKLRYIYDYIDKGTTTIDYTNSSLYDTLILKRGCCRGKSAAIYIISQYVGLPVGLMEYVTNKGNAHSANYMYYEDGTIKYVDAAAGQLFLSDHYYND